MLTSGFYGDSATQNRTRWPSMPEFLVYGATFVNLFLCFANTLAPVVSESVVIIAEVLLVGTAGLLLFQSRYFSGLALAVSVVLCNFLVQIVWRQEVDVKGVRDLLVILIFFWLGLSFGSREVAERIMLTVVCSVLIFGCLEWVFLENYVKVFDILGYYRARGTVTVAQTEWVSTGLFASGMRPWGREFFPFLGDHRVSSVFLEPVSMGNFAVIVAAWGLAHNNNNWRKIFAYLGAAALLIVAADARLAAGATLLLLITRALKLWRFPMLITLLPYVIGMALVVYSVFDPPMFFEDSFFGRLRHTGAILSNLDLQNYLGLSVNPEGIWDSGYGYSVQIFGILLCMLLWALLSALPIKSEPAGRFKAFAAVYIVAVLCVSGTSVFSIKTAALLWFVFGSLYRQADFDGLSFDRASPSSGRLLLVHSDRDGTPVSGPVGP